MGYDLQSCLDAIDPGSCDYTEWVQVGMALKVEGYDWQIWDAWSSRDAPRYHPGECERKWATFSDKGRQNDVSGGTVVEMARKNGWEPPEYDLGEDLGWEGYVIDNEPEISHQLSKRTEEYRPTYQIIDPTWVENAELEEPGENWQGWRDLVKYLETLFSSEEVVGYVVDSWEKDGRWIPQGKGPHTETAGDIIARIEKYKDDLASSLGFNNIEAGAWIRFNPLDGEGVRNDNVAEFRYALVESDEMSPSRQMAIMRSLELPIAAMVHSGNKSIHAIVHVDAPNYDEYRKRVDFLYQTCRDNGLKLDTQNKNPSRLSRMPGVTRAGHKQWLIATNLGRESWADWREWLDEQNDDLPEPESLASVWDDLPELAPPLIDGVLRQGHKMLIAGPSKAGKSFALIGMCVSIAEGLPWFGWECAQGRVLYVNLELDRASCLHRFKDVYQAMGAIPNNLTNIDIWNLRGKSKPMDELAPSLIRRALKTRPIAVIIDPIYKVITGDENSADQMAQFCNNFDKVADSLGCAVIYCHHHSKGSQGQKRSMDRASGSGVFARDPDALLDMIELHISEDLAKQQEDAAVCECCTQFLDSHHEIDGWREVIPLDDQVMANKMIADTKELVRPLGLEQPLLDAVYAARQKIKSRSAWRVEGTLREFPRFEPVNLWFDYPMHRRDELGVLADASPEGEMLERNAYRERGREAKAKRDSARQAEKLAALREGMDACDRDGVERTLDNVIERMPEVGDKQVSKSTVANWVKADKCDWCPIRSRKIEGQKKGVLYDPDLEAALEEW